MRVRDILMSKSPDVYTINPSASIKQAVTLLASKKIGVLVVIDQQNTPVGILSERDIIREAATMGAAIFEAKVDDLMTKDVIIALLDDELAYLTHTMTEKNIRHLPIMDDGKLCGLISIRDVVKAQLVHYEGEIHTLRYHLSETQL